MAYGNNGNGGRVSFARGTASFNQNPKNDNSRHFGGTVKLGDGSARWLSVWIGADRSDPQGTAKVNYIRGEMQKLGLYLSVDVGDIAPPKGQGGQQGNFQGNGQGSFGGNGFQGGQNGAQGGFGGGGGYQGGGQQGNGFQGGQQGNGGGGFGGGNFR